MKEHEFGLVLHLSSLAGGPFRRKRSSKCTQSLLFPFRGSFFSLSFLQVVPSKFATNRCPRARRSRRLETCPISRRLTVAHLPSCHFAQRARRLNAGKAFRACAHHHRWQKSKASLDLLRDCGRFVVDCSDRERARDSDKASL